MSGILGIIQFNSQGSGEELFRRIKNSIETLADWKLDSTHFVKSPCGRLVLAHGGPIQASLSQRINLAMDGTLYNTQALSSLLTGAHQGAESKNVGVELFDQMGPESIFHFDGSFALAAFDQSQQKVFLSVDHLGQRPLYVYKDARQIAFASEIKSLLACGGLDFSLDTESVKRQILYGHVPSPRTIYSRIDKIPAGHWQMVDLLEGLSEPQKYWDLPLLGPESQVPWDEWTQDFRGCLTKSVAKRLPQDDSGLVLLSGGFSSAVVAFEASKVATQDKLHTLHISNCNPLNPKAENESRQARTFASKINSDFIEIATDAYSLTIDHVLKVLDEPVGGSMSLMAAAHLKEARRVARMGLTGVGARELFHDPVQQSSLGKATGWQRLKKIFSGKSGRTNAKEPSLSAKVIFWNNCFSHSDLKVFLGEEFDRLNKEERFFEEQTLGLDPLRRSFYINCKSFLADEWLPQLDRISRHYGFELRNPFLDKTLLELAFLMPRHLSPMNSRSLTLLEVVYQDSPIDAVCSSYKERIKFPLENFVKFRSQGEDFHHLSEMGMSASRLKLSQEQFLALYSVESLLKVSSARRETEREKILLKKNLELLFDGEL